MPLPFSARLYGSLRSGRRPSLWALHGEEEHSTTLWATRTQRRGAYDLLASRGGRCAVVERACCLS